MYNKQRDNQKNATTLYNKKAMYIPSYDKLMNTMTIPSDNITRLALDVVVTERCFRPGTHPLLAAFVSFYTGYVLITFIAIGFFGNIVSLCIFVVHGRTWERAACMYLSWLAVTDIGCLYFQFEQWMFQGIFYLTNETSIQWWTTVLACKISGFVFFMVNFLSSWIIVAYSVERCFAVTVPLRMGQLYTRRRRELILGGLATSCLPLFLGDAITKGIATIPGPGNRTQCRFDTENYPMWLYMFLDVKNVFLLYVLPLIFILCINSVILFCIFRNHDTQLRKTSHTSTTRDMKATISLLCVSFMYLITMSPAAIFMMMVVFSSMTSFEGIDIVLLQQLTYFGLNITSINYSCNFLIYTVSLDFYRTRIVSIFCWRIPVKN
jgi:hypothetical protein